MALSLGAVLLLLAATASTGCLAQSTSVTTTSVAVTSSTATSTTTTSITCATGIHLIVARGSTEAPGVGRIGVVAGNVTERVPGSTVAAVDYPATFEAYFASEGNGTVAMASMVAAYTAACPDARIALLGYSQGGQVAMDVVCGTSETLFTVTPDLGDSFKSNIIAVVTFGDPSHKAGMPWNEGTSTRTGIFQRANTSACEPYTPIIKEWCDTGDIYCDSGNNTKVHGTYFANYTTAATDFIVGKFNESKAAASSTGSSTGTASSTGASSTATTKPASAAGALQPASWGFVAFLTIAGTAFGMLL